MPFTIVLAGPRITVRIGEAAYHARQAFQEAATSRLLLGNFDAAVRLRAAFRSGSEAGKLLARIPSVRASNEFSSIRSEGAFNLAEALLRDVRSQTEAHFIRTASGLADPSVRLTDAMQRNLSFLSEDSGRIRGMQRMLLASDTQRASEDFLRTLDDSIQRRVFDNMDRTEKLLTDAELTADAFGRGETRPREIQMVSDDLVRQVGAWDALAGEVTRERVQAIRNENTFIDAAAEEFIGRAREAGEVVGVPKLSLAQQRLQQFVRER